MTTCLFRVWDIKENKGARGSVRCFILKIWKRGKSLDSGRHSQLPVIPGRGGGTPAAFSFRKCDGGRPLKQVFLIIRILAALHGVSAMSGTSAERRHRVREEECC